MSIIFLFTKQTCITSKLEYFSQISRFPWVCWGDYCNDSFLSKEQKRIVTYQGRARTKSPVFEENFPAQTRLALSVLSGSIKKQTNKQTKQNTALL